MDSVKIFINPYRLFKYFWSNRSLILQFSKREILQRYRGSFLGIIWSIINPLIMLTVYTFVFSVVFKGKWGVSTSANQFEFAIIMFCGLIVFNIFNETINRAPSLIVSNVNYVKKVIFPLEILPLSVLISSLLHACISLILLIIATNIFFQISTWTVFLVVLIILPLIFLTLGISWFLASLGVFVRDMAYTVGVITTILFYITPIFYPVSAVPQFLQNYMYFNPLTSIVENFRRVVIFGQMPNWSNLLIIFIVSYVIMVMGLLWFDKTRRGFADVLWHCDICGKCFQNLPNIFQTA